MASAAGGTHPTGMHSCFGLFSLPVILSVKQMVRLFCCKIVGIATSQHTQTPETSIQPFSGSPIYFTSDETTFTKLLTLGRGEVRAEGRRFSLSKNVKMGIEQMGTTVLDDKGGLPLSV